jgi:hypothetical protein
MLGLMYLGAAALYLALMLFVVRWAWRKGRVNGGSIVKAAGFAIVGFLVVYLPVFWNHIPIVLAHRSMCAKDAGFRSQVAPEQWRKDNERSLAELRSTDLEKLSATQTLADGYVRYTYFGGLLASESSQRSERVLGTTFVRTETRIRDVKTEKVVAILVNYQVGTSGDVRPWVAGQTCYRQGDPQAPWVLAEKFHYRLKAETK